MTWRNARRCPPAQGAGRLPTDQKEVIVLGVFQDLSYAQMEEITRHKAVTLRSRMFHGLKKLGRMLGGEEDGEDEGVKGEW